MVYGIFIFVKDYSRISDTFGLKTYKGKNLAWREVLYEVGGHLNLVNFAGPGTSKMSREIKNRILELSELNYWINKIIGWLYIGWNGWFYYNRIMYCSSFGINCLLLLKPKTAELKTNSNEILVKYLDMLSTLECVIAITNLC